MTPAEHMAREDRRRARQVARKALDRAVFDVEGWCSECDSRRWTTLDADEMIIKRADLEVLLDYLDTLDGS